MTSTGVQCHKMVIVMLFILALTLLRRNRLVLHRRRKFTLLAQLFTEDIEANWYRDHSGGKATKKGASILNAKVIKHLAGEEGESSAHDGPQESVGCDGRGSAGRISLEGNELGMLTYNMR